MKFNPLKSIKRLLTTKTSKNHVVLLHKEGKSATPLSKEKKLKRISKRIFQKNANINIYKKIGKWGWLAILGAITIFFFYLVFFTNFFTIKHIILREGGIETENAQVQQVTTPLLNRHLLLTDIDSLHNSILNKVDNINELHVSRRLPSTLIIDFQSFAEKANVTNIVGKQGIRKKFIINEAGLLVSENEVNSQLPFINIKTDKAFIVGDQILKSDELKYILETKAYFEEKMSIPITEINYLPKPLELRILTNRNFEIWIDMSYDYKEQINKLKNSVPKINPYQEQFEYIDLRIKSAEGQKIIYKRR